MKKNGQIKTGIFLSYINFFITTVVGLVYIPFLIRMLSDSEYGLYLLMYSFMSIISVLDMGMTGTITRYYAKYENTKHQEDVLSISKKIYDGISLLIIMAGIILYFVFSFVYRKTLSSEEFFEARIILVIILFNAVVLIRSNIYIALIQAKEKFTFQRSILLLRTLLIPILGVCFVILWKKAICVFISHIVCNLLFWACYRHYVTKNLCITITVNSWDSKFAKEMLIFSSFLFLNTIVDELYWSTDSMILGAISGASAVTIYGTANTLVTQFRGFSSVIHGIFLPRITKLSSTENSEEINKLFFKVSRIQFFIVLLIYSGYVTFGKEFVILWAGPAYVEAYYLSLITMSALVVPLTQSICISILRAYNKQRFRAYLLVISAMLNVLLSIPAAYKFQGYGCASVTAFFLTISSTITMNCYYKYIKLDIVRWWAMFIRLLIPVGLSVIIMTLVKHVWIIKSLMDLSISILAYLLVYCCLTWFISFNKEEKQFVRSFL